MRLNTLRHALGAASAIALSVGFVAGMPATASAQTEIYAGGATLPAGTYRKLFNCYSREVDVNNAYNSAACTAPVGSNRFFGYASVGSGAGQRAFIFDDPTRIGVPPVQSPIPYSTTSGPLPNSPALPAGKLPFSGAAPTGYPNHHWSGSDAIITQNPQPGLSPQISYDCYNGVAVDPACTVDRRTIAGPAIQIPTMVTTVNIPFRVGSRTSLRLSQRSLCGIFTGNITNWNDPQITADNGGSVTGGVSRQIIVVRRADGSGTTFLFAQALDAVCDGVRGAEWTGGVGTSVTWPKPFFYAAPGNEGVNQVVAATNFSIGYSTPELTRPAVTSIVAPATVTYVDGNGANPITVNAGTYPARPRATLQNKAGAYVQPNPATGRNAMASASPPSGGAAANAANWGIAGIVADPTAANAYPIAGFTWFNGYTCYGSNPVGAALRQFFSWYLGGSTQPRDILNADYFGALPTSWRLAAKQLVVDTAGTRISGVSEPVSVRNPVCTGKPGA